MLRTAPIAAIAAAASTLHAATPPNDSCDAPIQIGDGFTAGTTLGATPDSVPGCDPGGPPTGPGVWYSYSPHCIFSEFDRTTISLCATPGGFDGRVSVFLQGPCGQLVCAADHVAMCDAGAPVTNFHPVSTGLTYLILVHSDTPAGAAFMLHIWTGYEVFDCNNNAIPDFDEIQAGMIRDCYNPAVIQLPHVAGGPNWFPDSCECPADWNRNQVVNSTDISAFLASWLASVQAGNTNADIDCSGTTTSSDISVFLSLWVASRTNADPFDGCP